MVVGFIKDPSFRYRVTFSESENRWGAVRMGRGGLLRPLVGASLVSRAGFSFAAAGQVGAEDHD